VATHSLTETTPDQITWLQLKHLHDDCYPLPPRNQSERVVATIQSRKRVWLASVNSCLLGLVMLSPRSKGGHHDNPAIAPAARCRGIGKQLVRTLLEAVAYEGPAMVALTTRIPSFFTSIGFKPLCKLSDGSTPMLILPNRPCVSDLLAP